MISTLVVAYLILGLSLAEQSMEDPLEPSTTNYQTDAPNKKEIEIEDIDKKLEEIIQFATLADKYGKDVPKDHTEDLYEILTEKFKHLVTSLKTSNDAYKILNNKEIDQTIKSITSINYGPLQKQLLVLLKTLFNVDPVTTNELLPPIIMDKLLYIFKKDSTYLQNYALDIMNEWLPKNPRIQARLMQLNGLELFYNQITKLDTSLVNNLLALFNNILEEHLFIRSSSQKDKKEFETMELYNNIGLIDEISSPALCNGIMNIFGIISTRKEAELHPVVYQLLKNIKPFCLRSYNGKLQVAKMLETLKRKVNGLEGNSGSNEVKDLLDEYIRYIKEGKHDEF